MRFFLLIALSMFMGQTLAANLNISNADKQKLVAKQDIHKKLKKNNTQRVIISLDTSAEISLSSVRAIKDRQKIVDELGQRSKRARKRFFEKTKIPKNHVVKEFSHLPLLVVDIKTVDELESLLSDENVRQVYEQTFYYTTLTQSLPQIQQPEAETEGAGGQGTSVVVLDTGVNYTHSDFGSCTSPGVPSSCRVIIADDYAPDDGQLDDNGHGTNVSAIVGGVAPETDLIVFDVFNGSSASSGDIIDAIDWAIENQVTYNIVAINMSLGDKTLNTSHCYNSFTLPFQNARAAGIIPVVSSGNDAYTSGISSPACNSSALSVGAVYDSSYSSISFGSCSDTNTSPDDITCFSNSGSILDMLAPGAVITGGGYSMAGTSMAAPHVAGGVAVVRGVYPDSVASIDDIQSRLTSLGPSILDSRNGIERVRLDLVAALVPDSDSFANAETLDSISAGTLSGNNQFATKQDNEPDHAGDTGGSSVWYEWTPPASGWYSFDTSGSDFETVLAIYEGDELVSLVSVVACSAEGTGQNGCQVTFEADASLTYRIAIDGVAGADGEYSINWATAIPPVGDEEIPFLPVWGYALLAVSFIFISRRKKK